MSNRIIYTTDYDCNKKCFRVTRILCPRCKKQLLSVNFEYRLTESETRHQQRTLHRILLNSCNARMRNYYGDTCQYCKRKIDLEMEK